MFGFIKNMFIRLLSTCAAASLRFGGSLASNHPVAKSEGRIKLVSLNKVKNMNVRSGVKETRFLVQHESCE